MFIVTTTKICPVNEWKMPLNHAQLYGTSEFTTMRLSDGKYYFYQEHLSRLNNKEKLSLVLEKIKIHFPQGEWSVRPTFFQKSLELWENIGEDFFVLVKPLKQKIHLEQNLVLSLTERGSRTRLLLQEKKIGSYFAESNHSQTLFHDGTKILEASTSNFFFRKKNQYFFPRDPASIFWGIGVQSCLHFFEKENLDCYVGSFSLSEIESMEEAWLVNSVRGLQTIAQIADKKLPTSSAASAKIIGQYQRNLSEFYCR